jgi:hypothetical protein
MSRRIFGIGICTLFAIAAIAVVGVAVADGIEYETDRPGADYKGFELEHADYVLCHRACMDDERCKAWTYLSGGDGKKPMCFLKDAVPAAVPHARCTSGVKAPSSN